MYVISETPWNSNSNSVKVPVSKQRIWTIAWVTLGCVGEIPMKPSLSHEDLLTVKVVNWVFRPVAVMLCSGPEVRQLLLHNVRQLGCHPTPYNATTPQLYNPTTYAWYHKYADFYCGSFTPSKSVKVLLDSSWIMSNPPCFTSASDRCWCPAPGPMQLVINGIQDFKLCHDLQRHVSLIIPNVFGVLSTNFQKGPWKGGDFPRELALVSCPEARCHCWLSICLYIYIL